MPMYSNQTLEAIKMRGFLHPSGRIRRGDIAAALATRLKERHVVDTTEPEHVRERAVTLNELTIAIFGVDDDNLRFLVSQLTTPAHDGPVQQRLNDGYILCAQRVSKIIGDVDGQPVMRPLVCRFVSSSPEVVREFLFNPTVEQAGRWVTNKWALVQLALKRVPQLEAHVPEFMAELKGRVDRALAPPQEA